MLIYLDLIFIINWWIDILLLLTTNTILKYRTSIIRLILSSFIGALSTFLFFVSNKYILFLFKIIICVTMQLVINKYKGIKTLLENSFYFYMLSIILAGTLYLLEIDKLNMKYTYLLLIFLTPIILYFNKKEIKKLNTYYKDVYNVIVIYNNKKYYFTGFLDTGNRIYDQYKKRPICLVYSKKIKIDEKNIIYVPIETANNTTILKCIKVNKIIIDGKKISNCLIGISNKPFKIQNINMLLHKDIIGGLN